MTKVGQLFEQEKLEYAEEQKVRMLISMIEDGTITVDEAAKTIRSNHK